MGSDSQNDSAMEQEAPTCEDPRIKRSRQALRQAFIELIEERGLDATSVNDLCQKAGLNRGTFYNHFKDKDDLLKSFEAEIVDELMSFGELLRGITIADVVAAKVRKEAVAPMVDLFEYLREEGAFLHAVLGPGGDMAFRIRLKDVICNSLIMSLLHEQYQKNPTPFLHYYVAYFAGAYLGVISHWIETGMQESSDEMARIVLRLLFIKPGEPIHM